MVEIEHQLEYQTDDSNTFGGFFAVFTDRVVRRHLCVYVLIILATVVAQNFRPAEQPPQPTTITYIP